MSPPVSPAPTCLLFSIPLLSCPTPSAFQCCSPQGVCVCVCEHARYLSSSCSLERRRVYCDQTNTTFNIYANLLLLVVTHMKFSFPMHGCQSLTHESQITLKQTIGYEPTPCEM